MSIMGCKFTSAAIAIFIYPKFKTPDSANGRGKIFTIRLRSKHLNTGICLRSHTTTRRRLFDASTCRIAVARIRKITRNRTHKCTGGIVLHTGNIRKHIGMKLCSLIKAIIPIERWQRFSITLNGLRAIITTQSKGFTRICSRLIC